MSQSSPKPSDRKAARMGDKKEKDGKQQREKRKTDATSNVTKRARGAREVAKRKKKEELRERERKFEIHARS